MKTSTALVLICLALLNTGCIATYLTAKESQREININRIIASQDKNAIDALRLGVEPNIAIKGIKIENGIGVGVDLFSLQTLTNNIGGQAISAIIDAAIIWGSTELIKYIKEQTHTDVCTCTCTCTCKPVTK